MPSSEDSNLSADDAEMIDVDPALSRQVDENLKLLYHSKLEATLPPALQALVDRLMQGEDEGEA